MSPSAVLRAAVVVGFFFGAIGCRVTEGEVDGGVPPGDGGREVRCADGRDDDGDARIDCADTDCLAAPACARDVGFDECSGLLAEADERIAPLDVVFVVDSSGSMEDEAALVQESLNAFAAAIAAAGIEDIHIVLLTADHWVTVPAPLGTDPERYLWVRQFVDSHASFQVALARYPDYASFLRAEAALHFVIVSDDESDLTGAAFLSAMTDLLDRPFVVHAIASPEGGPLSSTGGCEGPRGSADAPGLHYLEAVEATGGVFESICESDWARIFARLTEAVAIVRPIPCVFVIPPPPDGETFDRDRVNVRHTPGDGSDAVVLPRSDDCASGSAWRYDDPAAPTEVHLCTEACTTVAADRTGRLDVQFGCEQLVL